MPLTSHAFLLAFLPLALALYYFTKTPRQKMFLLLGVSLVFYGMAGWQFVPLLLGLSLLTWRLGRWGKFGLGVALNLTALLLFKYLFASENPFLKLAVPLGLSFYVFKHIGYLLDLREKRLLPTSDFWAFATFSAYFPQLSAGPISRFEESSFTNLPPRISAAESQSAVISISLGLAKKILIADTIGAFVKATTSSGYSGLLPALFLLIAFAAQLYFDFSGYTDLTLGISRLFGLRLPENFNNPYLATNPTEFWQRWHISLSSWFRLYVFTPLSRWLLKTWGREKREWAQYAANLVTMTLIGLWHGANWGYLLWGIYHGLCLNVHAWWQRLNRPLPTALERTIFLFTLLLGWAFFMSPNNPYLLKQLFGWGGLGSLQQLSAFAKTDGALALLAALPLAFSFKVEAVNFEGKTQINRAMLIVLGILAALCILLVERKSGFIYVQF